MSVEKSLITLSLDATRTYPPPASSIATKLPSIIVSIFIALTSLGMVSSPQEEKMHIDLSSDIEHMVGLFSNFKI